MTAMTASQAPSPAQALSISRHGHMPWLFHAKQTRGKITSEWWSSSADRESMEALAHAAGFDSRQALAEHSVGSDDDHFGANGAGWPPHADSAPPALSATTSPPVPVPRSPPSLLQPL